MDLDDYADLIMRAYGVGLGRTATHNEDGDIDLMGFGSGEPLGLGPLQATARSYVVTQEIEPQIDPVHDALAYIADLCEGVIATLRLARNLDPTNEALGELLVAAASDALEALGHLQAMTGQEQ